MKKLLLAVALLAALLSGCTTFNGTVYPTSSAVLKTEFGQYAYEAQNGVTMQVRTFVPSIDAMKKIPLVVYLHGAGQNGSDNERQLDDAVGCLHSFSAERDDYKAAILVPQCPEGVYWRDPQMLEALVNLIEDFKEASPFVDEDRIYVTGFSMGGDATWKLALEDPTLMSTAMPVCGGPLASMEPDIPDIPDEMADINIWAFNNFDDGVVRPNYAKRIFAVLWNLSDGDHLNFTENVDGGHNAKSVYTNHNVLIWLFNTRRR